MKLDEILAETSRWVAWFAEQGPEADGVISVAQSMEDPAKKLQFLTEMAEVMYLSRATREKFRQPLVPPRVFFEDSDYMGGVISLWPKVLDSVVECCDGSYVEAVFTGSIGSAKTTSALCITAYELYKLLNLRDPHGEMEMDHNSEIAFIFQSLQGKAAFTTGYSRFRSMVERSKWFQKHAPHNPNLLQSIRFEDHKVVVEALSGESTSAIGENVVGGLIDEINHMKVIHQSSKSSLGDSYDQALENYRAIARRRESRFIRKGRVYGMLCLAGSANYAGQFTDRKIAERNRQLKETGESNIYVYDKRTWDVQPEGRFGDKRFSVYIGDGVAKPYILKDGEEPPDPHIVEVPDEYRQAFVEDIYGALKDIAGIAARGDGDFIPDHLAIARAFGTGSNIFKPDWCNFSTQAARLLKLKIENPKAPRYVHIDLSLSIDSAGLAIGHVADFIKLRRADNYEEVMPRIRIEGLLSIKPSGGGHQIPFAKIRAVVKALIEMGYPVEWVSLDGFQSADTIQTFRAWKLKSGILSLDKKPGPYMLTKQAILDGRVDGPPSELARGELGELRWIPEKQKVDHPAGGSKDIADCIAGVVAGLSLKRKIWLMHGIPLRQVPESMKAAMKSEAEE